VQVGSEVEAAGSGGGKRIGAAPRMGYATRTQTECRPRNDEADQGRKKGKAQPARATTEGGSESAALSGEGLAARVRGPRYHYDRCAQWLRSALMTTTQRPR
jgi:hypothetical protein